MLSNTVQLVAKKHASSTTARVVKTIVLACLTGVACFMIFHATRAAEGSGKVASEKELAQTSLVEPTTPLGVNIVSRSIGGSNAYFAIEVRRSTQDRVVLTSGDARYVSNPRATSTLFTEKTWYLRQENPIYVSIGEKNPVRPDSTTRAAATEPQSSTQLDETLSRGLEVRAGAFEDVVVDGNRGLYTKSLGLRLPSEWPMDVSLALAVDVMDVNGKLIASGNVLWPDSTDLCFANEVSIELSSPIRADEASHSWCIVSTNVRLAHSDMQRKKYWLGSVPVPLSQVPTIGQ